MHSDTPNAAIRALKDERAYLSTMRDATAPESAFHASYVQDIAEIDAALEENAVTAEVPAGEGYTALVRLAESQINSAALRRSLVNVLNLQANPTISVGAPPAAMA